jgi:hypothetical protein
MAASSAEAFWLAFRGTSRPMPTRLAKVNSTATKSAFDFMLFVMASCNTYSWIQFSILDFNNGINLK